MSNHFSVVDVSILIAYILLTLYIGLRHTKKQKSLESYFLADRNIPWWAAGISIVASDTSAVSYIGLPAYVFKDDLQLLVSLLITLPIAWVIVASLFVPFMARLRLYTVYQYLEKRFGVVTRSGASALFMLLRSTHLAVAIYAQSLALTTITGLDTVVAVWVCGGVVTFYTVLGGMRAVIWTDVIQFFVTSGGIVAVLVAILWAFGGNVSEIWRMAVETNHTRLVNMDCNPLIKTTFWWLILGYLLNNLGAYSTDQVLVQRYLATKSRHDMVKAIAFNGVLSLPQIICLSCVGLGLTAYYMVNPSLKATLGNADQVLPHFIVNVLPLGAAGLVIAGMLAATMSSVSAGINSLSTATTIDFIQRFRRDSAFAKGDVRLAKWVSLVWGLLVTVPAIYVGRFGNVLETCITVIGIFTGPLLAMFLLGVLTIRANQVGVLFGALVGALAAGGAYLSGVSQFLWGPAGCAVGFVVGYLVSRLFPAPDRETILPLTVWAQDPTVSSIGSEAVGASQA
jgi:solute:Na+ symporter, SSS family